MVSTRVLALLASLSAPVVTAASSPSVLTPGGFPATENVREIPEGATIHHSQGETHVIDASGAVIFTATHKANKPRSTEAPPFSSGWLAYGLWTNTGETVSSYEATWTVPATPASNDGQILYYFPGLEPSSGDFILQPVLQYGATPAGGGNFWGIASWWVGSDGSALFTPLVEVSPGQSLQGVMNLVASGDGVFNYTANFVGQQALSVSTTEELVFGAVALEAYNLVSSSDYPTADTVFTNINIGTTTGSADLSWEEEWDLQDGILAFVEDDDGATGNEVTISYSL